MSDNDPQPERPPNRSPHAVPPRTIAIIFGVMLAGLAIGMLLVMPHYGPRQPKRRSALSHPPPMSMIGRETNGMVWIPGGTFLMGSNEGKADEQPLHEVSLAPFWVDKTEVTNEQFEKFVQATGYLTAAEKGTPPQEPGSFVVQKDSGGSTAFVPGANWRHPEGGGSTVNGREKHPVVHVTWDDAMAFAAWAGKRLPREAEWEYAARGGLHQRSSFVDAAKGANAGANFSSEGPREVGTFAPNTYGLLDAGGNVWEWCWDWYDAAYYQRSPKLNPKGPEKSDGLEGVRALRGGAFSSRTEARLSERGKLAPAMSRSDVGFRCVKDAFFSAKPDEAK